MISVMLDLLRNHYLAGKLITIGV